MGELANRVAVVTGGGRGLGRAYALRLAAEGAHVVVNSVVTEESPDGSTSSSAARVVDEIVAASGVAEPYVGSITTWSDAAALIDFAIGVFGGLDILVNNAGALRDRTIVNLTEEEWDDVVDVHLKGQAATLHWAGAYWRQQHQNGTPRPAAVVNTTAGAGLYGNAGQANYAAAKAGVAALTVVAARELERYGVRVNAVAPVARTRLMEFSPEAARRVAPPEDPDQFDVYDPANVAAVVAYLVSDRCHLTGRVLNAMGGNIALYGGWHVDLELDRPGQWAVEDLAVAFGDVPTGPPSFAPPPSSSPG